MFNTADVLVYIHPMIGFFTTPRCFFIACIRIAQIVPRRANKGIHRIGFARCRTAADRAGAVTELFPCCQGGYGTGRKGYVCRQFYGQLFFRNQLFTAFFTIYDRNRSSPIALTRNQPIAQTEVNCPLAAVMGLQPFGNGLFSLLNRKAVELSRVHKNAFARIGFCSIFIVIFTGRVGDDIVNGNIVLFAEFKVPLIVTGNAHNGTCPVIGENIVGNPDGNLFTVQGIDCIGTGKHACLFSFIRRTFHIALIFHERNVFLQLSFIFLTLNDSLHKPVFRSQNHKGRTENRIDTRREHIQFFTDFGNIETKLSTFTATDPVFLHSLNTFRPTGQQL